MSSKSDREAYEDGDSPNERAYGLTAEWPKIEIMVNGRRDRIVTLADAVNKHGLRVDSARHLASGECFGIKPDFSEVEYFRYTKEDSARDAAMDLLAAARGILGYAEGWAEQDATGPEEEQERAELGRAVAALRSAIARAGGRKA